MIAPPQIDADAGPVRRADSPGDENAISAAEDSDTPPERLAALAHSPSRAVRLAVSLNPSTPLGALRRLWLEYPASVTENPLLDLWRVMGRTDISGRLGPDVWGALHVDRELRGGGEGLRGDCIPADAEPLHLLITGTFNRIPGAAELLRSHPLSGLVWVAPESNPARAGAQTPKLVLHPAILNLGHLRRILYPPTPEEGSRWPSWSETVREAGWSWLNRTTATFAPPHFPVITDGWITHITRHPVPGGLPVRTSTGEIPDLIECRDLVAWIRGVEIPRVRSRHVSGLCVRYGQQFALATLEENARAAAMLRGHIALPGGARSTA